MFYVALLTLFALQGPPAEAIPTTEQNVNPLQRVVTVVGDVEIKFADIRAEVNRLVPLTFYHASLPEEQKLSTYTQALNNLVERNLIHQDAVARALVVTEEEIGAEFRATLAKAGSQFANISEEEFQELLASYRPQVVRRLLVDKNEARFAATVPTIDDAAVQARYDMVHTELLSTEEARFQHILVKVPPSASRSEGLAVYKAVEDLHAKIVAGDDFGEIAKEFSDDIFASVGGDMGFIRKGDFSISELDESAFTLADGQTSDILSSLYGFHILRRLETRPARQLSFEEAASSLRTALEQESESVTRKAWMAEMRKDIGVKELIKLEENNLEAKQTQGTSE